VLGTIVNDDTTPGLPAAPIEVRAKAWTTRGCQIRAVSVACSCSLAKVAAMSASIPAGTRFYVLGGTKGQGEHRADRQEPHDRHALARERSCHYQGGADNVCERLRTSAAAASFNEARTLANS
jgi:hypothetical protein